MTPELHKQFENSSPYVMIKELKSMFEKQAGVERFDLIQTIHACKQEEGKPVGPYVLKMKGYVEQLECLGYVLPQDISVGLILNGQTSNFVGFVRNYNMHNIGKTVSELHALLIECEKSLPKKAATPQVMAIQGGRIQKANKKSQNANGKGKGKGNGKDKSYIPKPKNLKPSTKERLAKDDAYHHCKEVGHWKMNFPVYLDELIMKKKQVGTASSSSIFTIELFFPLKIPGCMTLAVFHVSLTMVLSNVFTDYGISVSNNDVLYFNAIFSNGIYEIDMVNRVPNVNSIYTVSNKRAKHNLDSTYLWHCLLAHISKKRIEKMQHDRLLKSTDEESFDKCISSLSGKMTRKPFPHRTKRATDLLRIIHTDMCGPFTLGIGCEALVKRDTPDKLQQIFVKCIFIGYPKETMGYYFYFLPENKIVVARYAEFLEKNILSQEINRRAEEREEIQDEDTSPSENTSEIPMEVEDFEPPSSRSLMSKCRSGGA
ncbi:zinc finger, CCHC-type containing protein [Tanacetum coccineum]